MFTAVAVVPLRLALTRANLDRCWVTGLGKGGKGRSVPPVSFVPKSPHFARQLHYVLNFRAADQRLHWDSAAGCFPSGTRSPWQLEEFIFNGSTGRDVGVSQGAGAGRGWEKHAAGRHPRGPGPRQRRSSPEWSGASQQSRRRSGSGADRIGGRDV